MSSKKINDWFDSTNPDAFFGFSCRHHQVIGSAMKDSKIHQRDKDLHTKEAKRSFLTMKKAGYTPITKDGDEAEQHGTDGFSRRIMLLVIAVIASLHLSLLVTRATGSKIQAPLESMSLTARACTFKECFADNANHEAAPYTCLFHNGGPHGGW